MTSLMDCRTAKGVICTQLLQLGLGGEVVGRRATVSVNSALAGAGRNVHAVGVGRKIVQGKATRDLCVRIYIVQKLPRALLSPRDQLPEKIDGVPTDVVEAEPAFVLAKRRSGGTKRIKPKKTTRKKTAAQTTTRQAAAASSIACSTHRQQRQRPMIAGISAGHRDITAGTIGCLCRSRRTGDDQLAAYMLSNNHVFANVNRGLIADPLYQPAPADGGMFEHHVANLHRYVVIHLGGVIPNRVDAAIGQFLSSTTYKSDLCSIGSISGTSPASEGMLVRKHGRTTGYTEGKIDDADYDALVGMDHGDPSIVALFENQLRIVSTEGRPIGVGGDSGSAIVHRKKNEIVGLYFAGPPTGSYGVANRIEHVLTELEVLIP